MSAHLSLVPHAQPELLTKALEAHDQRAAWLDSLAPDRSRFRGSAGKELERKFLRPLAHDEQACQERCEEKVRRAKADQAWPCEVWKAIGENAAKVRV